MFTKFGKEDYWISSLLGIAFGDNTFIANRVIATVLYSYYAILSLTFFLDILMKQCFLSSQKFI